MKLSKIFLAFFLLIAALPLHAREPEVIVNNRVLAQINGKTITVYDVMRQMDVFLDKNHPELAQSPQQRYQFLTENWRASLDQLIENQLIIADANETEGINMNIPEGDIREKIHLQFGPNVMDKLDSLGMTYEEAQDMIEAELVVQRMVGYRVYSKALNLVGPQRIREAYQVHLKRNPPKEEWKYQVLSIRSKTEKMGAVFAQKAQALLRDEPLPFEALASQLKADLEGKDATIRLSGEYAVENKDLSETHRTILANLTPGKYSEPVSQVSRHDNSTVHRIFYLKEHTQEEAAPFNSMENELFNTLVHKEIRATFPGYLEKLRSRFNYAGSELEELPADFQPFSFR